uniref:Reverse transcriptase domain-containing protein n=1 Tax=Tanacetum cinerariifolium TaxID=118510 RepID=A0A6L2LWX5_TANCI|nr:reverse transcriptase domain-containing protein [Tanacetum cinerariifolium]
MDGSSCADDSVAGLILINPKGAEFTYALRFRFEATNNEAEYKALIAGLRIAEEMGVRNLQANVDSRLLANQNVLNQISSRSENKKADALSKISSTSFTHLSKQVLVEGLKEKLINEVEVLTVVEDEGNTWMTSIYEYLTEGTLPVEANKARADARALKRACQDCQVHRPIPRDPQQKLTPITSPWPFYKWRVDIAGPFPKGPGKVKFLIIAIDYFTKWIKAKPVATITGNQVTKFMWDNIVCRFRLPGEIISDNGKQFRDNPSKDWCEKLCIRQRFAYVKHPQANGLVKRESRSLGEGIKARLDARIIPAKRGMPTLRTTKVNMVQNDEDLEINLDLLEERR